jgi:hypothetical protein
MEKTLDLAMSTEYDLVFDRSRTLKHTLYCFFYTGNTCSVEYPFDFNNYTGATMTVKNTSGTIVQIFSTSDGSISFGSGGKLIFSKTAEEMALVRAGNCYVYDLYLSSSSYPKRAFLIGQINYVQNIGS